MADAGVLERRAGTPRPPEPQPKRRRGRGGLLIARRALTLLLVLLATFTGGYLALVSYTDSKDLSVGVIRMSVSPLHRGSPDLYRPPASVAAQRGAAACGRAPAGRGDWADAPGQPAEPPRRASPRASR